MTPEGRKSLWRLTVVFMIAAVVFVVIRRIPFAEIAAILTFICGAVALTSEFLTRAETKDKPPEPPPEPPEPPPARREPREPRKPPAQKKAAEEQFGVGMGLPPDDE
jgi:hypothetical protein